MTFDPWLISGWMVVIMLTPFFIRKVALWILEGIRLYEIRYLVPIPGQVYLDPNGDRYEILERRGHIDRWTLVIKSSNPNAGDYELTWMEDVPAFRLRVKTARLRKILARERLERYRPVR